jgi:hypothetical protein
LSQVSDSKTASRSSKCRKTTPPDRAASPKIPHSSGKNANLLIVFHNQDVGHFSSN